MLKFTDEQQAAVNHARKSFNDKQAQLAGDISIVGNAAAVPLDAWRRVDGVGTQIQRDVLAVFNSLSAASQTPVGVGDIVSYFGKISDSNEVSVSMDGRNAGLQDQAVVSFSGTPIPVIDSASRFGWRQMAVINKGQMSLDTATLANGLRKVAEKAEDMVLNGLSSIVVGGSTIYGLRNFPDRSTDTHGLDLNGASGASWLVAVSKVVTKLIADNAYGRITLYLNYGDYVYADMNEFVAGYPKTILQRLREISQIEAIVPASKVPVSEMIGVAGLNTGGWGTILSAMPLVTRPKMRHNAEDDFVFTAMMMAAPQFRSDANGQSQIAHVTKA